MEQTMNDRIEETERQSKGAPLAKLALVGAAVGGLFVLSRFVDIQGALTSTLEWIDALGWAGYLVFIGLYILACVFLVPGSLLTLGAGAIYGLFRGFLVVSIGSTLGATAAFLVGRYFARNWVADKVEGNAKFKAIDDAVASEGWKIVGLTRLSPAFPFTLLNYAYGLTKVSLRDYFLASWIGMIPGTVMYVYIGSLAGNLATLGTEGAPADAPGKVALQAVGLLATVAVTVYVTRLAKRALDAQVTSGSEG